MYQFLVPVLSESPARVKLEVNIFFWAPISRFFFLKDATLHFQTLATSNTTSYKLCPNYQCEGWATLLNWMGWSQAASADPAAVRRWRHPMTRLRMRGCVEDVSENEAASSLPALVLEMLDHCCSHILSALQFQLQSSIGWILES